ncbi:hypothetical protein NC652_004845 [Populus alba x Populus x berolinensis]|nr:hypothetical protein NC652_004845 [Populus alba x Populus x berolinensis]
MASVLTFACSVPAPVRASYGISQDTRPVWQENPVPSTWWSPLFLVDLPSPDYLNGNSSAGGTGDWIVPPIRKFRVYRVRTRNQVDPRSRFALGSFTEEKSEAVFLFCLRRKTFGGQYVPRYDVITRRSRLVWLWMDTGRQEK